VNLEARAALGDGRSAGPIDRAGARPLERGGGFADPGLIAHDREVREGRLAHGLTPASVASSQRWAPAVGANLQDGCL
jgi:hypothetical protein